MITSRYPVVHRVTVDVEGGRLLDENADAEFELDPERDVEIANDDAFEDRPTRLFNIIPPPPPRRRAAVRQTWSDRLYAAAHSAGLGRDACGRAPRAGSPSRSA